MHINNIFGGLLGFTVSAGLIYLFWNPMNDMLDGIGLTSPELKIFLSVAFIALVLVLGLISPLNLATSDDRGTN